MLQTQQAYLIRYKSLRLTARLSYHRGAVGSGDGLFTRATTIGTDASDIVYVTDNDSPETAVQKFTANGTYMTSWFYRLG